LAVYQASMGWCSATGGVRKFASFISNDLGQAYGHRFLALLIYCN
jgi:hypothetical protein